jgi:hypothetical protein
MEFTYEDFRWLIAVRMGEILGPGVDAIPDANIDRLMTLGLIEEGPLGLRLTSDGRRALSVSNE